MSPSTSAPAPTPAPGLVQAPSIPIPSANLSSAAPLASSTTSHSAAHSAAPPTSTAPPTSQTNPSTQTQADPLFICIECSYPVQSLYTAYSSADDKSLGRGVRLTQCPRCKRFADKYVEHDFVVLFIDMVLIKPQVYRHLLFNHLGRTDDKLDGSIKRLGVLLLLFDVYLTWARIEKSIPTSHPQILSQPIVVQYLFFRTPPPFSPLLRALRFCFCLTESLLFHATIRFLSFYLLRFPRPNAVSTALLVSSCTKLFPILMVIWKYDVPAAARSVGWAVVVNNVEALRILLNVDYVRAAALTGAGAVVRAGVSGAVLRAAGLGGEETGGGWEGWGEWVGGMMGWG
ncbi:Similar to Protein arv1; acc. no. Q9HDX5 [Pyronema omphalodes CBS 100304]|uniref:Protein ARV n=1 Tax=Pyronema omphalodes (strain CBS 100304) TaxID=1076935 RepID=U4LRF7_PYROM|nr:Similar to Protein arv1; acc. no. Q9HDX5 [Pyronema omphalodes CBS 100304]